MTATRASDDGQTGGSRLCIGSGILAASGRCESNLNMTQLTPLGLIKILAQVTAIMVIPVVGATVAGIVIDSSLGTSPLAVLIGLGVGTLVSVIGIWILIRTGVRKGYTDTSNRHGS